MAILDYFRRVFGIIVAIFRDIFLYIFNRNAYMMNNRPVATRDSHGRTRQVRRNINPIVFGSDRNYRHFIFFPLAFMWMELWLRIFGDFPLFKILLYPLIFGGLFGLLVATVTVIFKKGFNRFLGIFILLVLAVYFTTEAILRDSFNTYMTLGTIFRRTGNVIQGYFWETVLSILAGIPKIIAFFLPAIIYFFFGKRHIPPLRFHMDFVGALLIIFLGLNIITSLFAGGVGAYSREYEYDLATKSFGLITSTRLQWKEDIFNTTKQSEDFIIESSTGPVKVDNSSKISSVVEPSKPEDSSTTEPTRPVVTGKNEMDLDFAALAEKTSNDNIKKLHNYVATQKSSNKNEYTGLFKGKNLILVCAESYHDAFINEEATPTIWRLTHNGFYFTDYYQPAWGGSTSTGEFSYLLGLSPRGADEAILDTIGKNNYFTMPNQLQRLGYTTQAYHNGSYTYYDRDKTHKNLGFSTFIAQGNGLEKIAGESWIQDDVMVDKTFDLYADNQPFCTYYMSVSAHAKYTKDNSKSKRFIDQVRGIYGNQYKDTTLYYICYNMCLEESLRIMVEKLEAKGILDDTVIVMTTDHYPYGLLKSKNWGNDQDYFVDLLKHKHDTPWDRDKNGLIIWSGCLENENKDMVKQIDDPVYSLDILPTLSNLFGVEYDSRLLVGRDIFSDQEPLVFWNNYSWITRRGKYLSSEKKFYPNEGYEEDQDYINSINAMVKNKINYSRQVVNNDYYGALFGKDEIS